MASSREYLQYVLDQLRDCKGITYRPMMGEYIIYCHGTVIGGIYDDRFLLKPLKKITEMLPECDRQLPYEGGKEMLAADIEDKEMLQKVMSAIYEDLLAKEDKQHDYNKDRR